MSAMSCFVSYCKLDGSNEQIVAAALKYSGAKIREKYVCHQKCVTDGMKM